MEYGFKNVFLKLYLNYQIKKGFYFKTLYKEKGIHSRNFIYLPISIIISVSFA